MRFTIRNKLFLGFGVMLALMLAASLLALSNISRVGTVPRRSTTRSSRRSSCWAR